MTKQELIVKLVEDLKANEVVVNNKTADKILKSFVTIITESVAAGEKVALKDLGTWEAKLRKARKTRNPQTGEELMSPEKMVPKFKAANSFKALVAEKK